VSESERFEEFLHRAVAILEGIEADADLVK
jgi:hypothetical protein